MKMKVLSLKMCGAVFIANAVLYCACFSVLKAVVVSTGGGFFSFLVYMKATECFCLSLPCRRLTHNSPRSLHIAPSTWQRTIHLGNIPPCQFYAVTFR